MINILAIDDDEAILSLVRRALEKEGYSVTTLNNPLELDKATLNTYQLILLDVMMLGVDGFTLCKEIRNEVDCPILFVTAKVGEGDLMEGLGLGADDYITKPFGIGELRARVAAHLRRENREKKHLLTLGRIAFALATKTMYIDGEASPLTKSEYAICEYLALHRGQVFSKERIYEHVFGYDAEGDSASVAEHVKNIRAKCKKKNVSPIETVWGIGYKWQ